MAGLLKQLLQFAVTSLCSVVYEVGFLLGEFIIERGGSDALRRLAQLRGNTMTALEMSEATLVSEWRAWIRARHGV